MAKGAVLRDGDCSTQIRDVPNQRIIVLSVILGKEVCIYAAGSKIYRRSVSLRKYVCVRIGQVGEYVIRARKWHARERTGGRRGQADHIVDVGCYAIRIGWVARPEFERADDVLIIECQVSNSFGIGGEREHRGESDRRSKR